MGGTGRELWWAVRSLWRGPASVRMALLCLAVGIGMTAAAFSVVDAVLLSPLPFAGGDRLVTLAVEDETRGVTAGPLTWAELNAARSVEAIEGAEAYYERSLTLRGPEGAERVSAGVVTPGLFPLLGIEPLAGRTFAAEEGAEAGFEEVVLLGAGFWRRHFGADPAVVGRTLAVNERPMEIIGVLPSGVRFPDDQEVWLPLGTRDQADARRRYLSVVARLAPGATLAGARARLEPLADRIESTGRLAAEHRLIVPRPLRDAFVPPAARRFLPLMLAGVGLLLLVACANVANLLLTRSLERDREMAVRVALGASRGRLGRQLLAETGLLAASGAVAGLGIAWLWLTAIEARLPADLPYWTDPGLSLRATGFVVVVTALAALLSGAVPLVRLLRADPGLRLRSRASGRDPGALRGALVAAEIAICLILLVGAGLLARSFIALTSEDIGFPDERVVSFRLVLSGDAYDFPERRLRFYDEVTTRVAGLPDVVDAVATTAIPAADGGPSRDVAPAGSPDAAVAASLVGSSAGFFDALGIRLLAGRPWTAAEAADTAAAVAVLGEGLAARLWPGTDATGREIEVERLGRLRVIGVAPDLRYETVGSASALAHLQLHVPLGLAAGRAMAVLAVTRSETPPLEAMRRAVGAVDPGQAPYDIRTLPARRGESSGAQRLFAELFAEFGAMALLLALAGVYGTMAYDVRRRHHELGVRMALGATAGRIMRRVLLRGAAMAALGIGAGLAGVALGNRLLRGLLYGVSEYDPAVLALVAGSLLLTALLAALLPARRATRIEPVEVLRSE